jgi:hypothetical protein
VTRACAIAHGDEDGGLCLYIHSQLHISHCLSGMSHRDMKMREFCSKG